jgi:predicted metal-dependent phosphoesterase TrpH
LAGDGNIGRTHFARFLVAGGYAADLNQVYRRFLKPGKPGYVAGQWADLAEAVAWVRDAGGQAVIAHPARYRFTSARLRRLLDAFKACGGVGLEVVSSSHAPADVQKMGGYACQLGLLASAGSDYHGGEGAWGQLGALAPLPAGCTPIWSAWAQGTAAVDGPGG